MYEIRGLSFEYPRRARSESAAFRLDIEEFHLEGGEKLAVVGPNGAGKTTLLRILAFLERPTECSRFCYLGREVVPGTDARRKRGGGGARSVGNGIGLLRQNPWMFRGSVRDNLAFPLRVRGCPRGETARRIEAIAERLRLTPYLRFRPRMLSAGEQRRLALGRVLVQEPDVLLLDEPMAHLDEESRKIMEEILVGTSASVVCATHDLVFAQRFSDRVLSLLGGSVAPEPPVNLFSIRWEDGGLVTGAGLRMTPSANHEVGTRSAVIDPRRIQLIQPPIPAGLPNCFPGRIIALRAQREAVWLEVEAGEQFAVALDRSAFEQAGLTLHSAVTLYIPPEAFRVI